MTSSIQTYKVQMDHFKDRADVKMKIALEADFERKFFATGMIIGVLLLKSFLRGDVEAVGYYLEIIAMSIFYGLWPYLFATDYKFKEVKAVKLEREKSSIMSAHWCLPLIHPESMLLKALPKEIIKEIGQLASYSIKKIPLKHLSIRH